jgi:hypothetical protein
MNDEFEGTGRKLSRNKSTLFSLHFRRDTEESHEIRQHRRYLVRDSNLTSTELESTDLLLCQLLKDREKLSLLTGQQSGNPAVMLRRLFQNFWFSLSKN